MPVTVTVATGSTHYVATRVQPGRACVVRDDGRTFDVQGDLAHAIISGDAVSVSMSGDREVDLDAARAELMRAQAFKATEEARAISRYSGLDASLVTPADIKAAFSEAMAQARPLLREFESGVATAFPLSAEQVVNLLAETLTFLRVLHHPGLAFPLSFDVAERLREVAGLRAAQGPAA